MGSGTISSDPVDQTVKQNIQPGDSKGFSVRIHNTSDDAGTYRISGSGSTDLFGVVYSSSNEDVTEQVTAGEYEVTLEAHRSAYLSISISAAETVDTGDGVTIEVGGANVGGGPDVVGASVRVPPLRVWGVDYHGRFRCEASFPTRTLRPGYETGATFKITNLSAKKLQLEGLGTLKFRDAGGQDLWETQQFGGPIIGREIKPGETVKLFALDARVRWSGPLLVRSTCEGLRLKMPWVTLDVAAPGAPEDDQAAVDAAVATPGSPFQSCDPGADGEPTTGVFETPDDSDLPPLTLRCEVELRHENGFTVVALNLVSPQDAPDYMISEEPSIGFGPPPPGEGNYLAVRWSFVVTNDYVRPYISLSVSRAVSDDAYSPDYSLEDGEWSQVGATLCGHEGYSWGNGEPLYIDWVTACGNS